jgi:hypothetical protein
MTAVAIVVILGAFLAGMGATVRFAPPLAPSPEGRIAFWIVANLVGAAAGVIADSVWEAGHLLNLASNVGVTSNAGPVVTETVITTAMQQILLEGGVLIALAGIVYLLGARARR